MRKRYGFFRLVFCAFLFLHLIGVSAAEQTYPNRPIKIIVPFPPGGPTDNYARLIASKMQEDFKQPVVVDNRAGGTGTPGTLAVMNAPADGYTLLFTSNSAHLIGPLLKSPIPLIMYRLVISPNGNRTCTWHVYRLRGFALLLLR